MKLAICALTLGTAAAFTSPFGVGRVATIIQAERINNQIDLDSAKVVNNVPLEAGEKKVFCRCWQSGTFPLCDAAHVNHNKETGDNVGPLIVSAAKEE
mmetsp:Transcript_10544/g.12981  ORF Transcript_10544/g.12981 Transcript_10544/m.12981 type:complete len:98 (+) Transcript_10544:131-424(+)|eukprot:CAMPEP_0172507278 /NCGR_PEP_ID=MMETSP1066-20121228/202749_1 /TAXON_ID=671091 /ORGANISM="Coscinodiscus wailesii, Strain CCMP2513" /LENGTH=97 /DNA_ID=CAMNT_0013284777 /DNA_START=131 /DNA_END=424 /DNA_ORIENTATION=+